MDCTYKTNRYKIPLLEIIGLTPVGKNFLVAFVFMSNESENSYTYALHFVRDMFPTGTYPSTIATGRES